MAEPWNGVGDATMAKPIRYKRGLLGRYDAHTSGVTSVGTLQAR
jgi:tetrahydromethanopterin S-methyltransferase subunit F